MVTIQSRVGKSRAVPATPDSAAGDMLVVTDLTKIYASDGRQRFGRERAIDTVSFSVPRGEFFTLLGPSGCGKTTLLRCIAGLERPTAGRISVDGRTHFSSSDGVEVPAYKRNLGMVFQSYAIWPHMTVQQNASYPLRVAKGSRKLDGKARRELVDRILGVVGLEELSGRMATDLSGGQQQRLALARALIQQPPLLLLDEPLSNLDAKLRESMRSELRRLQRELGLTVIYVTHDQVEALSMSTRIAVMDEGEIQQLGTPREIYAQPVNRFVGTFIGASNIVRAVVVDRTREALKVQTALGTLDAQSAEADLAVGAECQVLVRPEQVDVHPAGGLHEGSGGVTAGVETATYLGGTTEYVVSVGNERVQALSTAADPMSGTVRVSCRQAVYPVVGA